MLFREGVGGVLAIGQPTHGWVCGQLARAWGNARFGTFAPWEEVCLAAEQHDVGMAAWEGAPTLDRRTGRAFSFMALPEPGHSRMFADAARLLLAQNRYAALLTSLHFFALAARHDSANDTSEGARAVREYLATEVVWQEAIVAGLRADAHYAPHVAPVALERNRRLVAAWDWLSLLLLMGLRGPTEVVVPGAVEDIALTLTPARDDAMRIAVAPWPFGVGSRAQAGRGGAEAERSGARAAEDLAAGVGGGRPDVAGGRGDGVAGRLRGAVSLVCEGRRLMAAGYEDDAALRAGLAAAPWVTLGLTLVEA